MTSPVRLGTRGSPLALWQATEVSRLLRGLAPELRVELVEIETAGDQVRDVPLPMIGGEGVFTREIQRALLDRRVDVAVHSLKDLPTVAVEGLVLGAVPARGPTGDVFVGRLVHSFDELPRGAVLATSSLRRRAQILHCRPDLRLENIRGNIGTRLRKLEEQQLDGLVLAQAGLERLGLQAAITEILDPAWMLPAVGQGALGLECRSDDKATLGLLRKLNDRDTCQAVLAERAMLRALGGGCQVPIGAASSISGDMLTLRGVVLSPDGKRRLEGARRSPSEEAETLGKQLAEELRRRGADQLLAAKP
jgi:hydroxymethylbilane synthase